MSLKQLRMSLDSVADAVLPPNKYFDIPQPVSSIFTGRQRHLEELQRIFVAPLSPCLSHMQKRFVIHGIGGSGKTQFVCKFSQNNRDA